MSELTTNPKTRSKRGAKEKQIKNKIKKRKKEEK